MCPTNLTRRKVVGALAVALGGVTIGGLVGYGEEPAPPTEDGSLIRGLLVGKPGFQPRTWRHFRHDELCGLSLTCAVGGASCGVCSRNRSS